MNFNFSEARDELHNLLDILVNQLHFPIWSSEEDFYEWFDDHSDENREKVGWAYGCTRLVFWDPNRCDYVFKMNLPNTTINYSSSEAYIYGKACEEGVGEWFASAYFLERIAYKGVFKSIYVMEYCSVNEEELVSNVYDSAIRSYCASRNIDWDNISDEDYDEVTRSIDYCECSTESEVEKYLRATFSDSSDLFVFLRKYGVNDTHSGNWGWNHLGHLVLLDYGGYKIDLRKENSNERN